MGIFVVKHYSVHDLIYQTFKHSSAKYKINGARETKHMQCKQIAVEDKKQSTIVIMTLTIDRHACPEVASPPGKRSLACQKRIDSTKPFLARTRGAKETG